ncbi:MULTISPECIES: hypothetical protein [Kribbella]|uniref:hypothetical protein n=1 Tax=Kribbella TaxID=182639 RepID=UPI0010463DC3|nr:MULTISPECIES: hypothetical protein [Kribbella]
MLMDGPMCLNLHEWYVTWAEKGEDVANTLWKPPSGTQAAAAGTSATASGQQSSSTGCDGGTEQDFCLVAVFDTCTTNPAPTLADPCDLSRKRTEDSLIVETVRLELRDGACKLPCELPTYHRVRVLLGLDAVGKDDAPGMEAARERKSVGQYPLDARPAALLLAFQKLASLDAVDLQKAVDSADQFPSSEEDAAVPLAQIKLKVIGTGSTATIQAAISVSRRCTLIPTSTIQDLLCALAPGLIGDDPHDDRASGPRVVRDSLKWQENNMQLTFRVTSELEPSSLDMRYQPVRVSSLSKHGWVVEDIGTIDYGKADPEYVTVRMNREPRYDVVRVLICGTGPTPIAGSDALATPLAGFDDGRPVGVEGRDAVWTQNVASTRSAATGQ